MKIGDLINLKLGETFRSGRETGTIIQVDNWQHEMRSEPIVEVLWNTGFTGWILRSRVNVMDEVKS